MFPGVRRGAAFLVSVAVLVGVCGFPPASYGEYSIPIGTSAISVEAETGIVLFEHEADFERAPASMIKLMLMLLVVEGIDRGDWYLDTAITASRKAQRMGGTQVFLAAGEVRTVGKLMEAVAISSANDAAMAVAEGLWGSEEAYLAASNARAAELGMTRTAFFSVHGLPPDRGEELDRTTARDMALLGRECVKHPQILTWTSAPRYRFRPGEEFRYTTNRLTRFMEESDGLKTGYIRAAGFCITATARRDGVRVISVVMGHPNSQARFDLARRLLLDGLDLIRKGSLVAAERSEPPTIAVENGTVESVGVKARDDLPLIVRKSDWDRVKVVWETPDKLTAPAAAGSTVGVVRAELDGEVLSKSPVLLAADVEEATWSWKARQMIDSIFGKKD